MQVDNAFFKAVEDNITAILGDCRPDPGIEQFLDLHNDFTVFALILGPLSPSYGWRLVDQWQPCRKVLHYRTPYRWLEKMPSGLACR